MAEPLADPLTELIAVLAFLGRSAHQTIHPPLMTSTETMAAPVAESFAEPLAAPGPHTPVSEFSKALSTYFNESFTTDELWFAPDAEHLPARAVTWAEALQWLELPQSQKRPLSEHLFQILPTGADSQGQALSPLGYYWLCHYAFCKEMLNMGPAEHRKAAGSIYRATSSSLAVQQPAPAPAVHVFARSMGEALGAETQGFLERLTQALDEKATQEGRILGQRYKTKVIQAMGQELGESGEVA